jgi:hypothetical protein
LKWATPASGATLIKRSTFSAVADTSTTFDSVFSSTYTNYNVIFNVTGATGAILRFQYRNGASTVGTNGYYGISQQWNFLGTASQILTDDDPYFEMNRLFSGLRNNTFMNFHNVGTGSSEFASGTGSFYGPANTAGGILNFARTTQSDGFILSADTGNITGEVSIYGWAK